ncbi:MAG: helix-hairpin-helix domain-containing protein [Gemmataceae bacterium]
MAAAVLTVLSLLGLAGFAWRPGGSASPTRAPAILDLNRASRADLLLLPGIGEQMADRIESYREKHGPFASLDDLRKVPGIGPTTLDRVRPWLAIAPSGIPVEHQGTPLVVMPETNPKGTKTAKLMEGAKAIDVNSATLEELQRLPGIGVKLSKRMVDERTRKPFAELADLRRVSGIGPKTLEKMRPFVVFDTKPMP